MGKQRRSKHHNKLVRQQGDDNMRVTSQGLIGTGSPNHNRQRYGHNLPPRNPRFNSPYFNRRTSHRPGSHHMTPPHVDKLQYPPHRSSRSRPHTSSSLSVIPAPQPPYRLIHAQKYHSMVRSLFTQGTIIQQNVHTAQNNFHTLMNDLWNFLSHDPEEMDWEGVNTTFLVPVGRATRRSSQDVRHDCPTAAAQEQGQREIRWEEVRWGPKPTILAGPNTVDKKQRQRKSNDEEQVGRQPVFPTTSSYERIHNGTQSNSRFEQEGVFLKPDPELQALKVPFILNPSRAE
ncbi:hypothetical protein MMC06_003042 [Schaereria dolodes]|nr:hypothetical protein [Schaereria dolodes]